MLGYCPKCKERSVRTKVYSPEMRDIRTIGVLKRVEFCINRGCGYKLELPSIMEKANEKS